MGVCFTPHVEEVETKPQQQCPGFEGFEKRLEVEFCGGSDDGLRGMSRMEIDSMLSAAECTIVSELSNSEFDSYVLSESSLFIYPKKIVIKTCGTTQLLKAIPNLLSSAASLSLKPCRCKYSRGTFIFPQAQPSPYGNFAAEVSILENHFGHLGHGGKAYVMGDVSKKHTWHVYVASAAGIDFDPTFTLEMCMTELDTSAAAVFYKSATGSCVGKCSARDMTVRSGIRGLLPSSEICDFAFDPCGYSMNSVEGNAHSTIHVTPEDGFSYASFESMGYGPDDVALPQLVDKVLNCFRPRVFSIAFTAPVAAIAPSTGSWAAPISPRGYSCTGTTRNDMPGGSFVLYHTFTYTGEGGGEGDDEGEGESVRVTPLALYGGKKEPGVQPRKKAKGKKKKNIPKKGKNIPKIGRSVEEKEEYIRKVIKESGREDAMYVMDKGAVVRLMKVWKNALPRVRPYYAVKCNPDPYLLTWMAEMGAGFDIASKAELEAVKSLPLTNSLADDVIFANPCKLPSHIAAASEAGVVYTTYDSEGEIEKLSRYGSNARVLLRIRADDAGARCQLGNKYGAEEWEWKRLLKVAVQAGIHVAGVAFHVGSGAMDASAYAYGVASARKVYDMGVEMGVRMEIVDIGGGLVSEGGCGVRFGRASEVISLALEEYFPESMGVKVIGEPGRYFAEEAFTLAAQVFGCRKRGKSAEYWINDGIYGSMNCLLYDHATLSVRTLRMDDGYGYGDDDDDDDGDDGMYETRVFGPTCDGLDCVMEGVKMKEMKCGDWLVFGRMGAYTKSAGSSFNGFDVAKITTFYVDSS